MGKNKNGKIKNRHKLTQGNTIELPDGKTVIEKFEHPVFCFKYLDRDYGLGKCTEDEKAALIDTISKISSMTWKQMRQTQRHGIGGGEKIPKKQIKRPLPSFITPDVDFLLAYRFSGNKPFLGHQHQFVLHVIFIDRDFTLYDHN